MSAPYLDQPFGSGRHTAMPRWRTACIHVLRIGCFDVRSAQLFACRLHLVLEPYLSNSTPCHLGFHCHKRQRGSTKVPGPVGPTMGYTCAPRDTRQTSHAHLYSRCTNAKLSPIHRRVGANSDWTHIPSWVSSMWLDGLAGDHSSES